MSLSADFSNSIPRYPALKLSSTSKIYVKELSQSAPIPASAPSERLVGLYIERRLLELGYDLFHDRETLKSEFVRSDILKGQGKEWQDLEERGFDVIHCSAVFHLFTLDEELAAAKNIARLIKRGGDSCR
ncbi:uncharacterized protein F4812DRAFT_444376 [Daldinia caldariorum]|uniref:uncharacterized protein n=1 Tax=Daldinia caldariorum TaxID=326644 RepID=UPI002008104B|nr:uncharacterized protein F4812DRAFT_444376 [Daldinia caldariorum]KAI1464057.1 hypothetical protein F4812DRAFT_444376 [Daldinia caldariorum]